MSVWQWTRHMLWLLWKLLQSILYLSWESIRTVLFLMWIHCTHKGMIVEESVVEDESDDRE